MWMVGVEEKYLEQIFSGQKVEKHFPVRLVSCLHHWLLLRVLSPGRSRLVVGAIVLGDLLDAAVDRLAQGKTEARKFSYPILTVVRFLSAECFEAHCHQGIPSKVTDERVLTMSRRATADHQMSR